MQKCNNFQVATKATIQQGIECTSRLVQTSPLNAWLLLKIIVNNPNCIKTFLSHNCPHKYAHVPTKKVQFYFKYLYKS